MPAEDLTLSVTVFKARCLDLFKRLEDGKLKHITITRRGAPVASVTRSSSAQQKKSFEEIYGCMRGTVELAPSYDPFEQVIDPPDEPLLRKRHRHGPAS